VAGYKLTIRRGPRVERRRYPDLESTLAEVEALGQRLAQQADAKGVRLLRRVEPVQQVVARIEVAGPRRLRAGLDVRGDGSTEGYTGRIRRKLIEQRHGESPYDALRRALAG
jgi:hypothetical protein